jgi:DNA uptake protein ComE-like DNA-binding protein
MNHIARFVMTIAVLVLLAPAHADAQVGRNLGQLLDPNRATKEELQGLPGLNAAIADEIIAGRPWIEMTRLDTLLGTKGLTPEQRKTLYARLWDPINLNTATEAEMLLIPGSGSRMAHEFEEYRPYVNIAQFHREMRKYWDEEEVARLEQFVFVPIDLNTASDADILTIPGSGNRVLREFKEYRPYTSIEQFRREMGKYWDAKEVARLEQYVKIGGAEDRR